MKKKFYQKAWFIILMLIFLFPIGVILVLINKEAKPVFKVIVSILLVLAIIGYQSNNDKEEIVNDASDNLLQEEVVENNDIISENEDDTQNVEEVEEIDNEGIEEEVIEPNTSEMIDSIYYQAKEDFKNVSTESLLVAINYIKDNYKTVFKDNESMEQFMYYGFYLEQMYINSNHKIQSMDDTVAGFSMFGLKAVEYVKYVYRGAESMFDDNTKEKRNELIEFINIFDSVGNVNEVLEFYMLSSYKPQN